VLDLVITVPIEKRTLLFDFFLFDQDISKLLVMKRADFPCTCAVNVDVDKQVPGSSLQFASFLMAYLAT
jgi:hypothetical protein